MISSNSNFNNGLEKFVVKLPFTTGSKNNATVKTCKGFEGILKKIKEFQRNPTVYGYFPYVIIQPFIIDNTEAKIVCFNGKALNRNPNKRGSSGRSMIGGKETNPMLFKYAEEVISELKNRCPSLISNQLLRVDMFQNTKTGLLIVNEVEGFEAQSVGSYGGNNEFIVSSEIEKYWESNLTILIDYYLKRKY